MIDIAAILILALVLALPLLSFLFLRIAYTKREKDGTYIMDDDG